LWLDYYENRRTVVNLEQVVVEEGYLMDKAKKLCVIGLDAALPNSILKYVEQGVLPNFEKLIKTGVMARNGLVPYPTITPPNWTTIATGSWPGTHGITDYNIHEPGTSLHMSNTLQAHDRRYYSVENIWEAAEKVGKKSIVLNYAASYGCDLKEGIVVGGRSNIINEWRDPDCGATEASCTVCADQAYSTILLPRGGIKVEFDDAEDWENVPASQREDDQETEINLPFTDSPYEMEPTTWYLLAQDGEGKGYDRLTLSPTKDYNDAFCTISSGQWSKQIRTTLRTLDGEEKEVSFHVKLLELSEDLGNFRLYVTGLGQRDGWSNPPELAKKISDNSPEGDFAIRSAGLLSVRKGWIDLETYMEITDMQNIFLGDAAAYLLRNHDWDIFYMHNHAPDWFYHGFMKDMDPVTEEDGEQNRLAQDAEKMMYISCDRMIGRILEAAGEDVLAVIVSDHGAVSDGPGKTIPAMDPLIEKGLIKVLEDKKIDVHGYGQLLSAEIDWTQTKAIPQRIIHIYVNVKGRDPDGIVEPGEEYEQVRQEIIDALMTWIEPETGKRPFSMALRREDARPFGIYGERAGDVIYAIYPWFGTQHGNILPTAEWGLGTLKPVIIMNGPGIKRGEMLERTFWITDIVPTACYLMDLPLPDHAEGAVIYQAFEDPDFKQKEVRQLKEMLAELESRLT